MNDYRLKSTKRNDLYIGFGVVFHENKIISNRMSKGHWHVLVEL